MVRVSRRVGGAADLLAPEMWAVEVNPLSKSPLTSPSSPEPGRRDSRRQVSTNFTHRLGPVLMVRRVRSRGNAAGEQPNDDAAPLRVADAAANHTPT